MGALFAGTGRLVRLALRRDRIKLTLWLVAIIGMTAASVPALEETYGSPKEQVIYATTISTSLVGRAFGGAPDGANMGSIAMVELFAFTAVLVAFMSTLTVVRHTRQNEEMGSAELIGSAVVGRYAQLSAGILVAVGANAVLCVALSLIMLQLGSISAAGAWCFGAAMAAVGVAFTAIAAVTAQLAETSRGANAMAGAAIGVAYLLRALGDAFGTVHIQSFTVESAWPSWLSPIGWGQLMYPLTQQLWWMFGLFAAFFVMLLGAAFWLLQYRDEGAGIVPARRGAAVAAKSLLSPLGIAWRLQRGVLLGWLLSFTMLGFIYGGIANEFQPLLDSVDIAQQYLVALGGSGSIVDAFFGAMLSITAITALGYVVQTLVKLRSEEVAGRMEVMLATSVGRLRWLFSHVVIACMGIVLLMLVAGATTGLGYVLFADASWHEVARLTGAALVPLPAVFVTAAAVVALFAVIPRLMIAGAWTLFVGLLLISQLGALLRLPDWVMDMSPFTHMPSAPLEQPTVAAIAWPVGIGLALLVVASVAFRSRNMTT